MFVRFLRLFQYIQIEARSILGQQQCLVLKCWAVGKIEIMQYFIEVKDADIIYVAILKVCYSFVISFQSLLFLK